MAVVQTLIGNVKGPQGETGATGAQGAKGDAATITVGSVSTTAYGNAARVENVGTENDAILNFTIPQGAPGQRTTTTSGLTLDTVTTSTEEFPVPAVGENGATVWGKVIKWFADGLAAIRSKLDANKVVNSQTVTEAGYALDAQQANPNVSGSLAAQISDLNDSLSYRISTSIGTFFKVGKAVLYHPNAFTSQTIAAWGSVDIGDVPHDCVPFANVYFALPQQNKTEIGGVYLRISTTGKASLMNQTSSSITVSSTMVTCVVWGTAQ